jgi:prepilin-type N-terminal cleavage/methylation domain-containing protein
MPFRLQMRKAFTLIELLVVLVIIGVLAGIVTAQFTKARENGWSARCKANLRSLHQATLSRVNDRGIPGCDTRSPFDHQDNNTGLWNQNEPGWVHGSPINMAALPVWPNGSSQDSKLGPPIWWGDPATWSIQKGTLWEYTSQQAGAYLCPKFAQSRVCGRTDARRSYVMNTRTNWGAEVSRQLLFAEMQPQQLSYEKINGSYQNVCSTWAGHDTDGDDGKLDPGSSAPDPGTPCCSKYESIGCIHPMGGEYRGHCVFMDGHVEAVGLRQADGSYSNRTFDACNGAF